MILPVLAITEDGLATGIEFGTATVTATSNDFRGKPDNHKQGRGEGVNGNFNRVHKVYWNNYLYK